MKFGEVMSLVYSILLLIQSIIFCFWCSRSEKKEKAKREQAKKKEVYNKKLLSMILYKVDLPSEGATERLERIKRIVNVYNTLKDRPDLEDEIHSHVVALLGGSNGLGR